MDRKDLRSKLTTLANEMMDGRNKQTRNNAAAHFDQLVTNGDSDVLWDCATETLYNLHRSVEALGAGGRTRLRCISALGVLGDLRSIKSLSAALQDSNRLVRMEARKALNQLESRPEFRAAVREVFQNDRRARRLASVRAWWLSATKPLRWIWKWTLGWIWGWVDEYGAAVLREDLPAAIKLLAIALGSVAVPPFGVFYVTRVQSQRERAFSTRWMWAGRPMTGSQRFVLITAMLNVGLLSILVNELWTLQHALVFLSAMLIICFIVWLGMEFNRKDRYFHGSEWLDDRVSVTTQFWLLLGRPFCWIGIHSWDWDAIRTARSGLVSPHSRECKRCQKSQIAIIIKGVGLAYREPNWKGEEWQ